MISPTGVWSEKEQSGHIFSYGVARWIGKYLDASKPVIDLGCGKGMYCEYLSSIGFACYAYDGYPNSDYFFIRQADLTKPLTAIESGNVICLEVFEHIHKEHESMFVGNIANNCSDKLIISVAHEGQKGTGHVNCRPSWYVKELFESKGFKLLDAETKSIRQSAEGFVAYFRENLFVFTR